MSNNIEKLLNESRRVTMTAGERDKQRLSFAYGTTKIENSNVTRAMVEDAAKKLAAKKEK